MHWAVRAWRYVVVCACALAWAASAAPAPASAQHAPGSAVWQPATGASGDDTYLGAIDTPANGATLPIDHLATISGWFVDTTAQGWPGADDMQVYVGTMDKGTPLIHGSVALVRDDLVAATNNPAWSTAGWSAVIDPGWLPAGDSLLTVYLHTPAKGWWFTQITVTVGGSTGGVSGAVIPGDPPVLTVSAPKPNERISIHLDNYQIIGFARDPAGGPRPIDWVKAWLNGEPGAPGASYIGEANLNGDGTWELDFTPSYIAVPSNLYVYAHSDLTNKVTLAVVHFTLINTPP